MNVKQIVKACFANPRRTNYPCIRYASSIVLKSDPNEFGLEKILKIIDEKVPLCLKEFDSKKYRLFSEEGFKPGNDNEKWKKDLKSSRWHGPFVWNDSSKSTTGKS